MPITRDTLEQCYDTMKLSESIWERMQRLRSRMEGTTPSYSTQPKGSGTSDKVGDGVAEYMKLLREFHQELNEYSTLAADVNEAIQLLEDPKLRNLLELRYLNGQTWKQIANAFRLPASTVRGRMHDRALRAICNIQTNP